MFKKYIKSSFVILILSLLIAFLSLLERQTMFVKPVLGTKIFSKKKGETVYSIRAIPVGGFCAMAGEDGEETDEKGKKIPRNRKFYAKPIWQRFLILFFGAGNNFILAFLFLFLVGLFGGAQIMDPVIGGVTKDYPVAIAGIEAGDEILEVNGHKTPTIDDVQLYITLNKVGNNLDLKIKDSEGNIKDYSIKPIKVEKDGVEGYYYGLEFKGEYEKYHLTKPTILRTIDYINEHTNRKISYHNYCLEDLLKSLKDGDFNE
jgi:membrane-associated protease RseP (regulator of RpoE activity)